jgi:AraC family L-rhamnose operon transcriptional activator RhaR
MAILAPSDKSFDGPLHTFAWQHLRQTGDAGVSVRRETHTSTNPHDHLFHELVYVEAGAADHETAGGTQKLRPGDLIVIRPQVWHAYANGRGLAIINCLIDNRLMQQLAAFFGRIDGAFELFRRRPRNPRQTPPDVLHASPVQRSVVLECLESIMAEQRSQANGWQDATTAAVLRLLVVVARLRSAGDTNSPRAAPMAGRTDQAVLDAASYLEAHFSEPVSLDDLAGRVHLSPGHLSRSFTARMGMGVVEYTHRLRAEEACRLLRCTEEPVSQIASRVGYDEIAYFSRCFRSQMDQSPTEYRRTWHRSG